MLVDWASQLGMPASVAQGYPTVPLRLITEWVAHRFGLDGRLVRTFVAVFFREVAAYLGDSPEERSAARDTVATAIRAHRPTVVIAHSLGSVVAYEALCANPDLDLDLLVTVGSPLAMPNVVLGRVQPAPAASANLRSRVRGWLNIADVGDLIALPPRLCGVYDVDSDDTENIHLFDFHRATNYLRSGKVAAAVRGALR
jgi:pimeloyl-ACP methyl ester carboxylesterase